MKAVRFLFPFIVISVLCVVGVEVFYRLAEQALFRSASRLAGDEAAGRAPEADEGGGARHDYRIIVERNLFGAGPAGSEAGGGVLPAGLSAASLDYILLGTVTGEKEDKRAVILDRKQQKQQIYHVGDALQGAVVKDILRGKVILGFGDREEYLDMTEARQYLADAVAAPSASREEKGLSSPEPKPLFPPVAPGVRIAPHLRKFSAGSGTR